MGQIQRLINQFWCFTAAMIAVEESGLSKSYTWLGRESEKSSACLIGSGCLAMPIDRLLVLNAEASG